MAAEGHCNCGSVRLEIPNLPANSLACYCSNCRRAGGGIGSFNYMLDKQAIRIQDPAHALKQYADGDTDSGRIITRNFCGTCGSPVMSEMAAPSTIVFVKASLFDYVPAPSHEGYEHQRFEWARGLKPQQQSETLAGSEQK